MAEAPFQLRYELNRRQRLVPHLKLRALSALIMLCIVPAGALWGTWWGWLFVLGWVSLFRHFFLGILNVVLFRTVTVDLRVEENALGFLARGQRWWLFLDGLTSIDKLTTGVWTLQHWNGCVVHIPENVISEGQLEHLRNAMARGKTPEGMQAVIERGRRLEALYGSRFGRE